MGAGSGEPRLVGSAAHSGHRVEYRVSPGGSLIGCRRADSSASVGITPFLGGWDRSAFETRQDRASASDNSSLKTISAAFTRDIDDRMDVRRQRSQDVASAFV